MPFGERMQFAAFVENQEHIESGWDKKFGDRKNEIVFIWFKNHRSIFVNSYNLSTFSPFVNASLIFNSL